MPYKSRPMSEILAPAAPAQAEGSTGDKPAPKADGPELDPKYEGKDVTAVIDMHQNSEKRLGELQNEVGQLRGLVTELSTVRQPAPVEEAPKPEPVDVSGEDIISDPVTAVNKILQPELAKRDAQAQDDRAATLVETEGRALVAAYDVDTIVASPEFQAFAARTPSRQADFLTAANGEGLDQVRAARRLLEDYTDFKAATTPEPGTGKTPLQEAKTVTTESGGVAAPLSPKPSIHEEDVIKLINTDPVKYRSPAYQAELMEAVREGRLIKAG